MTPPDSTSDEETPRRLRPKSICVTLTRQYQYPIPARGFLIEFEMQIFVLCYILFGSEGLSCLEGGKLTCQKAIYIKVGLTPRRATLWTSIMCVPLRRESVVFQLFRRRFCFITSPPAPPVLQYGNNYDNDGCICIHNGHKNV